METAALAAWNNVWRGLWNRVNLESGRRECIHVQRPWRRFLDKPHRVLLGDAHYCVSKCLELAVIEALQRMGSGWRRAVAHRIPLGLLLLSRGQVTPEQLRCALEAQSRSGRGRIGEWLQTLGFVNETQVTAALAHQWSCPVLRTALPATWSGSTWSGSAPKIPLTLLQAFTMIPVEYVAPTTTLHLAFGEGVDYSLLYAIEQMAGCRTQACMTLPSSIFARLRTVSTVRTEDEVVFDRVTDLAEQSRIIRSYCARLCAAEIRMAICNPYLWVRLFRADRPPLDLLFGTIKSSAATSFQPPLPASPLKSSHPAPI